VLVIYCARHRAERLEGKAYVVLGHSGLLVLDIEKGGAEALSV